MKKIISVLMMISLLLITGCNDKELELNDDLAPGYRDTVFVIGYNFSDKNPLLYKNDTNREIFSLIYEPLFEIDEAFYPQNILAKNIEIKDKEGLKYQLEIKKDITFHNGEMLKAKDVKATIDYLTENDTKYNYNVKDIESTRVISENTIEIVLFKPTINFSALLTFPIVSSSELDGKSYFNGTGKYKVSDYVERKSIDLVKNDDYHGEEISSVKNIKVHLVPDKETANYSYQSGMADIYSQDIFDNRTAGSLRASGNIIEYMSNNYGFLLINNNSEKFKSVNVRRAIDMAIDKESIAKDVLFSRAEAVATPMFKNAWCYNEKTVHRYNMEEAKNILKKEGFYNNEATGILQKDDEDSTIILSFEIMVNSDNDYRIQIANKISENLKFIGIDCKVNVVSYEEYRDAYSLRTYDALLGSVQMSYDFDLNMFMGEDNVSGYRSSTAQDILKAMALQGDIGVKKSYFRELQNIFYEDIPHISLFYTKESIQSSGKVQQGINPTCYSMFNKIENWSFDE